MRPFHLKFCFLFLVSTVVLATPDWRCRFALSFAGGTDSQDVVSMYEQVWRELGTEVSQSVVQKMIRAGDPFSLDSFSNEKSATLRETLKELEAMLTEVGVDLKETKKALLKSLAQRVSKTSRVEEQQQKRMQAESLPSELLWGGERLNSPHISPDGRTIFTTDNRNGIWVSQNFKPFQKIEHGTKTGKTFLHFNMTPDGKYVFFNKMDDFGVYRAKLTDEQGKPLMKWNPELWHSRKPKDKYDQENLGAFEFSPDGKHLLAEMQDGIYILDPNTPSTNTLKPIYHVEGELRVAKFLPGSNDIILFDTDGIRVIDLEGKLKRGPFNYNTGKSKNPEGFYFHRNELFLSPDSKTAYTSDHRLGILEVNLQNGRVTEIKPELKRDQSGVPYSEKADFTQGLLDPKGRYFYLVKREGTAQETDEILTYDLHEKKFIYTQKLPYKRVQSLVMDPSQNYLMARYSDFEGFTVHRPEEFLPTP